MNKLGFLLLGLCVFRCSVSQSDWRTDGELLNSRAGAGAVTVMGKIYIVGGLQNPFTASQKNAEMVEAFNPVTNTCIETSGRIPTPRHLAGIATDHKNLIYVAGGADTHSNFHTALEVYDVEKDKWTKLANMPTSRQQTCAALVGDSLFVIGGDNGAQNPLTKYCFEVYVVSENKWVKKSNMELPVRNACAVVFDSKIYVIGGHELNGNGVLEYNPQTGKWTRKANMPTPRTDLAVELVDGKIYAIGGHPGVPVVEEYEPQTNSWRKMTNIPDGRCFHASAAVKNRIYLLGGANSRLSNKTHNFKTIESFTPHR